MSATMARYGTGLPLWDKLVLVYGLGLTGKRLRSMTSGCGH